MVIESLNETLIVKIRSSSSIDSISQCVTELVLNSLDAKSTSIAIRINLLTFRIQVIDDGKGISQSNLKSVGIRYMTNKCHTLNDLKKHLKYYGFKGEALANIAKVSQKITIISRESNTTETYEKIIENDCHKIELIKNRPSIGTTITVEGFLGNLPVRQQCIKNNELDNIKKNLEALIIIHPRVSFTLRNDIGRKLLLASVKCQDVASSFKTIHPEIDENEFTLIKVTKKKISVEGLIHKNQHETKRYQYIFVNKRPITNPKLQNLINLNFKKLLTSEQKKKLPIFIIHIKCPYSDIDLTLEPSKTAVLFKKFDIIKRCVEKMISTFFGKENLKSLDLKTNQKHLASEFGVSQIGGAVKGFGKKRKNDELDENIATKSPKIINDSSVSENTSQLGKTPFPGEISKNKKEIPANTSLWTNFPENEKKGKDVIMDMFILSLKAFPAENQGKTEASDNNLDLVKSTGIQTSPSLGLDSKVSVGIQTSPVLSKPIDDPNLTFFSRKPIQKYVSDYDFDFSTFEKIPNLYPESTRFCRDLNQTKKIFDFQNNHRDNYNIFNDFHQAYGVMGQNIESNLDEVDNRNEEFGQQSMVTIEKFLRSVGEVANNNFLETRIILQQENVTESPYFSKKLLPQEFTNSGNPEPDTSCDLWKTASLQNIEISFAKKDYGKKRLNESNVSKYFSCTKSKRSKISPDLFQYSKSLQLLENSNNKTKDLNFSENIIAPTLTQTQNPKNNCQTISYLPEEKKDTTFDFTERFNFVPKGLSPILKDYGKVKDMSPESKQQLQTALIQSYDDELLVIKWQNFMKNQEPKKFFEEIYLEKSKLIESEIPNAYGKTTSKGFETMSFTKSFLKNLQVIGQVDKKFIAVFDTKQKLILLFDQHAVHERVRLEELSQSYKNASTKLDQIITIFLPQSDLTLLKHQKTNLNSLGLILDFFANGITIFEVPLCLYNKSKKGIDIVTLTEILIKEVIEILKINNGIIVSTPKIIQNIVNSEACRGAIKFGDFLTRNECVVHLKNLVSCDLPFQCAHGRPTLTPLLFLNLSQKHVNQKPQLKNLIK